MCMKSPKHIYGPLFSQMSADTTTSNEQPPQYVASEGHDSDNATMNEKELYQLQSPIDLPSYNDIEKQAFLEKEEESATPVKQVSPKRLIVQYTILLLFGFSALIELCNRIKDIKEAYQSSHSNTNDNNKQSNHMDIMGKQHHRGAMKGCHKSSGKHGLPVMLNSKGDRISDDEVRLFFAHKPRYNKATISMIIHEVEQLQRQEPKQHRRYREQQHQEGVTEDERAVFLVMG